MTNQNLLLEIDNLLSSSPLQPDNICQVYHDILLDNAAYHVPNKAHQYAEEFLANAMYLLELGSEQDARFQIKVVKSILSTQATKQNNNSL